MIKSEKWKRRLYQIAAFSFLICNKRSGLFLDPGLGKTSISLWAIKVLLLTKQIRGVLLIAPIKVCYDVWPDEISKWKNFNKLSYTILHEKGKQSLFGPKKDIYLMNPEGLPWLMEEAYKHLCDGGTMPFDTLWIDESTKFKNPTAKTRFQKIETMLPLFKRRHIMTGTPAAKSYLDLWSQIYILDEGKALGSNFYQFRNRHFSCFGKYNWVLDKGSTEIIKEKISHIILNISEKEHLKLPPVIYNYIKLSLPSKAMKVYKEMEREFFSKLDANKEISAKATAQASGKCHQIANGNIYEDIPEDLTKHEKREFIKTRKTFFIHDVKIEALKNLIDELNGKPLLIVYWYDHDLKSIQKALGEIPNISRVKNTTESTKLKNKWNNKEIPLMLSQPMSMAHGLNLQKGGNDICWFSMIPDLELYIQLNKRIARSGVVGEVRIHHLIAKDTIDEAMVERLGKRAEKQIDLRDAIKMYRKRRMLN